MSIAEALLTAEEYRLLPDNGQPTELIKGRLVTMNMPAPRHGQICNKVGRILGNMADERDLGHVVCNDSGVLIERDPDTVRGADVSYYSYARVPRGPLPEGYLPVPPDAAFEIRSPGDRWADILIKVGEYLNAGVTVACVLDSVPQSIHIYHANSPEQILGPDQEFTLPEVFGDFRILVRRFFE